MTPERRRQRVAAIVGKDPDCSSMVEILMEEFDEAIAAEREACAKVAEEEVTRRLRRGTQERGKGQGAGAELHAPNELGSYSRVRGTRVLVHQHRGGAA